MCAAPRLLQRILALGSLMFASVGACAEHVSVWGGGGVGAMLTGAGAQYVNGHKMAMLAVTLPNDRFRLRLVKGSFERTRGIQPGTGDNDVDYEGFDIVVTQAATELPIAFAIGASRFEEAYRDEDLEGRVFVHQWGPHVSVLRSWPLWRFCEVWAEADLHYAPYSPGQTILFLDVGIGARF